MKILMLSSTFPYPPTRGGTQVRTFNLLKYLNERHDITMMTQSSEDITDEEVEVLRELVKELVVFPRLPKPKLDKGILKRVQHFNKFVQDGTPPHLLQMFSDEVQKWVDKTVTSGQFEVVTCEHSENEIYVRPEWQQQLPIIVNIHRSFYGTQRNLLETGASENKVKDQLNLTILRRYEELYCSKFTNIVVTTPEERRLITSFETPAPIAVIPNGVDFSLFPRRISDPGGHKLIFVGAMDNRPDIDAVRFFVLEVFPEIQERYPGAALELVGARPTNEVLKLGEQPGIKVTGKVPSIVDYLHKATVCIVPLRTGYGIKNKTLEAMAAGIPVVGSDRGLEGLTVDGADVPIRALRANEPAEYVYAISRLFEDRQLRKQLSENGRKLVKDKYTWKKAGELYEKVLLGTKD